MLNMLFLLLGSLAPAHAIKGDGPTGTEDYYWHKRGGTYLGGAVPFDVPTDFSKGPAWTFGNPHDELFRHGPVIDGKRHIYLVTAAGWIRKFSPDGELLWSRRFTEQEGKTTDSPFLYKGKLYLSSMGPGSIGVYSLIHCFDMETGDVVWTKPVTRAGLKTHESTALHVAEDVLVGALGDREDIFLSGGCNMLFGMNATDGSHLWDFKLDAGLVWNFMPSTAGDGSFFFSTTCGAAERRSLGDGRRIWQGALREKPGKVAYGTGGGVLGPNGVFYAESNHIGEHSPLPGVPHCEVPVVQSFWASDVESRCPEGEGLLTAYRAEDGEVLWSRRLPRGFGGSQYPAVGKIHGGRLAVVGGIGMNSALAWDMLGPAFLPWFFRELLFKVQYRSALFRWLIGVPIKRNAVAAFDAETGKLIWMWEEEPWSYYAAKGDEETFLQRLERSEEDPRFEMFCAPDNWGIPAITADGTVIIGSGSTGDLLAIRDENGDGVIQDHEVATLKTEQAFLNNPGLAPGLMAVAPCWGPMYVFKSDQK